MSTAPHPHLPAGSPALVGRVDRPGIGPAVVTVRGDRVIDITSRATPTVRDLIETGRAAEIVRTVPGEEIGTLADLMANSMAADRDPARPSLLSPIDLQTVKAAGVTFVVSLMERVIEEQARGAPEKAAALRGEIQSLIGEDLSKLEPGSPAAMKLKEVLIARGAWSQYLEVGIGPDCEIFTKAPTLASVGYGADVGLHPMSQWNNPEPEVVMVVASTGAIVGATLGNDVNLRDVEGRSALLLGKAKDNNASAALGPFIRLFDANFTIGDIKRAELSMEVTGTDGFVMTGTSNMARIARPPEAIVAAAIGRHHQYPDGLVVYLGTMFAPVTNRGTNGKGFTHHLRDVVTISTPLLGTLVNRVGLSTQVPEWTFGLSALMRNLAGRDLLG